VASRPELVQVRDVVVRHFHSRASIEEVGEVVLAASRSMREDRLTMEEILVVLKGAVTLAAAHVNQPSALGRAAALRPQMTSWLISLYMDDSGEFAGADEE
jgi:hypothetical protein